MKKNIIPLARSDIQVQDIAEVAKVLNSGMLVQGLEVLQLENIISKYIHTDYCSAISNGTASLQLALISLGIGPGDEVIIPSYSFVSTANAFVLRGAKIVFADSRPDHPGIDGDKIKELIAPRTKVIVPIHCEGAACGIDTTE